MLRTQISTMFLLSLVLGCGPGGEETEVGANLDVRIDMAPQENDPDSKESKMCVNDAGEVFVIWVDNRDGKDDVWFNRSLDLGQSWMPAALRLNRGDSNVWNASVACNSKGVYVVWEDDRDGELQNHNIYFNRSVDGGDTWAEQDLSLIHI